MAQDGQCCSLLVAWLQLLSALQSDDLVIAASIIFYQLHRPSFSASQKNTHHKAKKRTSIDQI